MKITNATLLAIALGSAVALGSMSPLANTYAEGPDDGLTPDTTITVVHDEVPLGIERPMEFTVTELPAPTWEDETPTAPIGEITDLDCLDGYVMAEDGSCVPSTYYDDCPEGEFLAVDGACWPDAYDTPEIIYEDDPRWDCRTMGNQSCGVEIGGLWYIVVFEDGQPVDVYPRGF